mmetsp:Transcript_2208/g.6714  ORF Transcript_2208/g.6714 Transcript_2208/m.6714 type:complete len:283 (+) Transcript_2208:105-953(+)
MYDRERRAKMRLPWRWPHRVMERADPGECGLDCHLRKRPEALGHLGGREGFVARQGEQRVAPQVSERVPRARRAREEAAHQRHDKLARTVGVAVVRHLLGPNQLHQQRGRRRNVGRRVEDPQVHAHPQRPQVRSAARVAALADRSRAAHLGRKERRRAPRRGDEISAQPLAHADQQRCSKISELDQPAARVAKHVLRLEVAVADAVQVEVLQAEDDVAHPRPQLRIGHGLPPPNRLPQISALDELHHQVHLVVARLVDDFEQLRHVPVPQQPHDGCLPLCLR